MFGNRSAPQPPPPPAPPPNPPTYASVLSAPPQSSASLGRYGGLSTSILSGPLGPTQTQRKSLLGQ